MQTDGRERSRPRPLLRSSSTSKKGADPAISPLGGYLAITREGELRRLVAGALRPALGDGFFAGVEAHTVRAVGVQVAEQRALPAAEAVVADRYRQRYVDADHADYDFVGVDGHLRGHLVEQGAADEEAVFIACHHQVTTVNHHACALGHTSIDVAFFFSR